VKHGPAYTGQHPGCRATPTIDNGKLYLASGVGLVRCYEAKTGKGIWSRDLNAEFGGANPTWGRGESVLIHENAAIVTPGGSNAIVALNKETGATIWTSSGLDDAAAYASPTAIDFEGHPIIVQVTAKGLVAVDARDGRFLWRNDRVANKTANCPSPVYANGYVFAASGYGTGGACMRLGVKDGRVTAEQVWETRDMVCHHGGYVVVDGYIYGNHGQGWNCLELATGRKVWEGQGVGKGSVIYADGMLYTYGENGGRIGLVEATPKEFHLVSEFSVAGTNQSWAHLSISDGRLYARYDDNLYVLAIR
jgi:outer membrane protein assembly factor BamB